MNEALPLVAILALGLACLIPAGAISAIAQVPTASGNRPHFEVASIRKSKTGDESSSNFPLGPGPAYGVKGGLFVASNQTLETYIYFAFKPDMFQNQQFKAQLPDWVRTTAYDIEARADGNPSKDDMRLMMQSLLEERFHMVLHRETRDGTAYGLMLVKPAMPGPKLKPHPADDSSCSKTTFAKTRSGALPVCGASVQIVPETAGDIAVAGYNMSMDAIALELDRSAAVFGGVARLADRRIVNLTGLVGTYDYTLEYAREQALTADVGIDAGPGGPSFAEALKSQLGLRLVPQKLPLEVIVVDRIEHLTEN